MGSTSGVLVGVAAIGAIFRLVRRPTSGWPKGAAVLVVVALVVAACSNVDDDEADDATSETEAPARSEPDDPVTAAAERVAEAEEEIVGAQAEVADAGEQLCADTEGYIEAIDRYGKLFTDAVATVGDVKTLGSDLAEPQEAVAAAVDDVGSSKEALAAAQQELLDAQAELAEAVATASSLPTSSSTPATVTTTTLVPQATVERVQQAEDDLARAADGITDATPLTEATAEYNSAAYALQIAWLRLLSDAGCLTEEQQAEAVGQVAAYTSSVQTELQQIGYFDGDVDGVYGPRTVDAVKRLQSDNGLPETGFVDIATSRVIDAQLADLEQSTTAGEMTSTAAVQTILTLTRHWTGPIDGQWTDELTAALMEFQIELGVEPTGVVDPPTLTAFEDAIAALRTLVTTSTTVPASTTPPTEPLPNSAATSAPTESSPNASSP